MDLLVLITNKPRAPGGFSLNVPAMLTAPLAVVVLFGIRMAVMVGSPGCITRSCLVNAFGRSQADWPWCKPYDAFRTRFLKESRIAASLSQPNVIPIYDVDVSGYDSMKVQVDCIL
jgi:hypothetical protein